MKIFCKLFGHKYNYFITQDSPQKNIRSCKNCNNVQEYKFVLGSFCWVSLVQRKKIPDELRNNK